MQHFMTVLIARFDHLNIQNFEKMLRNFGNLVINVNQHIDLCNRPKKTGSFLAGAGLVLMMNPLFDNEFYRLSICF